ncbi:hypothetical protein NFI96_006420 [Prochilodus magdalenae]|nr:hypothetical protein NFI96_006420 [Prochilodus magdalenae]
MKQESPTDIIRKQAVNSDYTTTGYDRGHLCPSCFQSPDNRLPTFTLTNAAPLDPCFNRVYWYKWESALKKLLKEELGAHPNGIAYIVTGTVPHPNYRIPQKQPDDEEDIYRDEMVTVPTHVWTAVCFTDFSDKDKPYSFSFGYIGVNSPDGTIMVRSVSDLNSDLTELYRRALGKEQAVSIFADDCNKGGQKLNLTERIKSRVRLTSKIEMPDEVRKYFRMPENSIPAPEDSTHCQDDELYYIMESGFKPCCTTLCLFQKQLMSYWCSSGQKQIQCSPEYPTITANGETCKDDHLCDTHGLDYYWCYKKSGSWDYCSPLPRQSKAKNDQNCRPNHVCAKYGQNYNWCYTDDNNNWSECCTSDDCSSAINSKTCKHDHQCGYHGEDYLWCYTTDGSWDYCCTRC